MKLVFCALPLALLISFPLSAQSNRDLDDPTGLSRYAIMEDDETPITISEIELMESNWRELLSEENCADAIPLLHTFAIEVNRTANLLQQGAQPIYNLTEDGQRAFIRNTYRDMWEYSEGAEEISNQLRRMRNAAWVEEAACLVQEGREGEAVNKLFRALDFINGRYEKDLWERASSLMWDLIGYKP